MRIIVRPAPCRAAETLHLTLSRRVGPMQMRSRRREFAPFCSPAPAPAPALAAFEPRAWPARRGERAQPGRLTTSNRHAAVWRLAACRPLCRPGHTKCKQKASSVAARCAAACAQCRPPKWVELLGKNCPARAGSAPFSSVPRRPRRRPRRRRRARRRRAPSAQLKANARTAFYATCAIVNRTFQPGTTLNLSRQLTSNSWPPDKFMSGFVRAAGPIDHVARLASCLRNSGHTFERARARASESCLPFSVELAN